MDDPLGGFGSGLGHIWPISKVLGLDLDLFWGFLGLDGPYLAYFEGSKTGLEPIWGVLGKDFGQFSINL